MQQRNELAHVARVSTMGQLASSLAHELNQPLGAILRNAEAAELFLQDPSPDLDEVRAILADIRKDDQRAGAVIDRMRALMKRREVERRLLDLNLLAGEVVTLVRPDAEMRQVRLALETDPALPPVHGDRVQLQQVLLNLLLNAMDAVSDNPPAERRVARANAGRGRHGRGRRERQRPRHSGGQAPACVRAVLHFQAQRPGDGIGDLPQHHRGARRTTLGGKHRAGGATFTFTLPAAEGGERDSERDPCPSSGSWTTTPRF